MINELYALSRVLSDMNIETEVWHREYKKLPNATAKAPCFRIWISEEGSIIGIDELNPDIVQKLRKYGNNHESFPAFNIKPLYRITDEHQKKMLEEIEKDPSKLQFDIVKSWLTNDNWQKSLRNIDSAINSISSRLLRAIEQYSDESGQLLTSLIYSVSTMKGGFRAELEAFVLNALEKGDRTSLLLTILLHSGNADNEAAKDMGSNISVILEFAEWENFGYPIASEHITAWINDVLVRADDAEVIASETHCSDAFGSPFSLDWSEPMPSVKLPGFDVILRSMFHGQPCQQRYRELDDASYHIAKENRIATKQALEWMSSSEQEGVTWKRADKDEFVFIFASRLTPLRYASLLGPPTGKETEHAQIRFENCVQDFSRVFSGLPPKEQPKHMRIFSIRKMDRARSKVVFTRDLSPEWLNKMAEDWQFGCYNIPKITFTEPIIPFPLEVARIINTVWKRDGKQAAAGKNVVKRIQYYQGMELLLDLPSKEKMQYFIHVLLSGAEGLISFTGNRCHGSVGVSSYYEKYISEILAMLGLLLYKSGNRKEDYMQDMAFLVGQLLKASDDLHTFYCKVERKGDVPPQLAGNSMLATASETPHKALAQLCLRMNPYISWAKRYCTLKEEKNGVANGLVGWYFYLFENISSNLAKTLIEPTRFNDFDKAQLFLGYLAAFPKREKPENESCSSTDNNYQKEENSNE